MTHQSVLFHESLEALNIQAKGIYVDATFGRGGHSMAILEKLDEKGRLIVIDKDSSAIEAAHACFKKDARCAIYQDSFANIKAIAEQEGISGKIDGILLDLGVSSPQLDTAERGFSFLKEGPLDMRMDQREGMSAADWIRHTREEDIANVLYEYGDERYSRRIARSIVEERRQHPIETTTALAQIIAKAHPAWEKHKHPATKSFQAIRIFINHELDDLQEILKESVNLLAKGGRLVVISFHSLEDRIVKQFLKKQSEGEFVPSFIPMTSDELSAAISMKRIGKAIRPSMEEIAKNPRARSATLRIGEKIK